MMNKIVSSLILAIGIIILGICVKSGIDNFSSRDRIVTVRGLAEREVKANKVTWPIVCKEVGNDLPALYTRINNTNEIIVAFLKTNGVLDSEITINAPDIIDLQAERYSNNDRPFRYNVTSVITVTSQDVDKVRKLIDRQTELLKQGIAITAGDYNYQTMYDYTDLNKIKPEMIAEATSNAREAANKFAADSESELGKIKTASQGQFSIENRDPYTPYIKKVRVVSTIVYYLED
ncbi:MAG: SIMPL domain-containing protein [Muribaculaceae bacterium]|nr:SIMPL domain-containing protein [Muribaculaceae bacterium]